MYYQSDSIQLRDIHKKHGEPSLQNYPLTNILWHKLYLPYFKGIKLHRLLDFMPYDKEEATKFLVDNYGYQRYPQKHFESRFTRKKDEKCPFCRTPFPSEEEMIKRHEKRIALNDARAILNMGLYYSQGQHGLPQNIAKALQLWQRAGELGDSQSNCNLAQIYCNGYGVEVDMKKAKHYRELAAMGGSLIARKILGDDEVESGNFDRALKHYQIGAKDGHCSAVKAIQYLYLKGNATKVDYAEALSSYQTYLDEIKSEQRDEAAAFNDEFKYYESSSEQLNAITVLPSSR